MKVVSAISAAVAIAALAVLGYLYIQGDDWRAKLKESEHLEQQMHEAVQQLQQQRLLLQEDLQETKAELHELKTFHEKLIKEVNETNHHLITELEGEIARNQVKITQLGDSLQVSVLGSILFPSGETQLTEEGVAVVRRIGHILKNVEDKGIRVEGHTDDVPVSASFRKFSDNWELSAMRAINVVKFLVEVTGLAPAQFEAVGMSEHHPIADNETEEGRSRNRRIEIMLIPLKRVEMDVPLNMAIKDEADAAQVPENAATADAPGEEATMNAVIAE